MRFVMRQSNHGKLPSVKGFILINLLTDLSDESTVTYMTNDTNTKYTATEIANALAAWKNKQNRIFATM